jgi:putative tryptophan/tyrosine transport system substrate-binding protein
VTDRRTLLGALAGGLVVLPLRGRAQQPAKIPRVGVIGERTSNDSFVAAFRQALRDLGYVEGQTVLVEFRSTNGLLDRVPGIARELVRMPVDVIVVGGGVSAQHAMAVTTSVPIVFTTVGDPVGIGLVASLSRPGGNATGMSNLQSELGAKQLELLKEVAPRIARVAALYNPGSPISANVMRGAQDVARALAVELLLVDVRNPDELPGVLSALAGKRADALIALSDPVFGSQLAKIAQAAARLRLPSVYARREFAAAGGLLAYGPNFEDNYRSAATYVDRILKGAAPAGLPVQQPTRLELIINRRAAKALGLAIPQAVLLRANEVIE